MTQFNCTCEDTLPARKTLSELRITLMRRLGFAAQVSNPPPGMNELLSDFLTDAQDQLYRRYACLRTERIFSWQMPLGERYYDIGDSDKVTASVTVDTLGGLTGYNSSTGPFGSVDPSPWLVGQLPVVDAFYTDGTDTTLVISQDLDTFTWETISVETGLVSAGVIELALADATLSSDGLTYTWADTVVWSSATDDDAVRAVSFLGFCESLKLDPYTVIWAGITDQNEVWYPLIEGIPPELYTRVQLTPGWPTRYEIRSCIEVFPAPQAVYTLRVKGQFGLQRFTEDTDKTTIDSSPVFLMALANAKLHYGKPDAASYFQQTMNYLGSLVAGGHGTARYVPNPRLQVEALTPPRMTSFTEG